MRDITVTCPDHTQPVTDISTSVSVLMRSRDIWWHHPSEISQLSPWQKFWYVTSLPDLQYSEKRVIKVIRESDRKVIKESPYSLLYWGIREVTQDRIELSSFLIYSINTFTIATGSSTLTMTLTHCYNSL